MSTTHFELLAHLLTNLGEYKISPATKLVLLGLANHYPNITCKQTTLAAELGISRKAVNTGIQELESLGCVKRLHNKLQMVTPVSKIVTLNCNQRLQSCNKQPKQIKNKSNFNYSNQFNQNNAPKGIAYQPYIPEKIDESLCAPPPCSAEIKRLLNA